LCWLIGFNVPGIIISSGDPVNSVTLMTILPANEYTVARSEIHSVDGPESTEIRHVLSGCGVHLDLGCQAENQVPNETPEEQHI
jgi:hypothetical protein